MLAWIVQTFESTCEDYEGNKLYGYVAVVPQDEKDEKELLDFLYSHGAIADEDEEER